MGHHPCRIRHTSIRGICYVELGHRRSNCRGLQLDTTLICALLLSERLSEPPRAVANAGRSILVERLQSSNRNRSQYPPVAPTCQGCFNRQMLPTSAAYPPNKPQHISFEHREAVRIELYDASIPRHLIGNQNGELKSTLKIEYGVIPHRHQGQNPFSPSQPALQSRLARAPGRFLY